MLDCAVDVLFLQLGEGGTVGTLQLAVAAGILTPWPHDAALLMQHTAATVRQVLA